jgi:hypothetical protein
MYRYYTMFPGRNSSASREFYAPNLDFAFAEARATWPLAVEWTCVGSRP